MSSTATKVDSRIVSMQFDNQQFEKNVQTSLGTIDKLKQSLNLTGAAKGFENIGDAAKNVNMSPLSHAAEAVGLKFSAMQVMAVTALSNITNSAVNAGKRIASALTIDPIKMGFSEYETQINAVQTILANTESKGKTLEDVNGALDELNTYADKTIYNFTEMTRNIGTFTAAGVDLDTSVSAIKGIANLAAVSGSTSQQASTAMYQLSQALASGTVKLMDWNSVVNAGMGGQVFQDALKETARVHGIAIDDLIKKEGSFRETLQHGWLSSEILTETLSKFTGDLTEEQLKTMGYTDEQIAGIIKMGKTANDAATKVKTFSQLFDTLKEAAQSGWTQTWEIVVGDFEEAKELLTKVSDTIGEMIGNSAEARNELLENWKVLGGRDDLIESVANAFKGLMSIITPIKEAFREIFPPLTAEKLAGFTSGLKELTSKFKLSDTASENLKRTFKGLFAVLDIVKQLFVAVVKAGASLFGIVGDIGGGILGLTGSFGDWLVTLNNAIRDSDIFNKVLQGIVSVVKAAFKGVSVFAKFIKDKIVSPGMELFHSLLEKVAESMTGVGNTAGAMRDGVVSAFDAMGSALEGCTFFKLIETLWNGIIKLGTGIVNALGSIIGTIIGKLSSGNFSGILDFVNALITGGIGVGLIKFLNSLKKPFDDVGGFLEGITGILDGVRGCFEAYQQQLQAGALMKIAQAIAILAASLLVLSFIDADKLGTAIGAISALFVELLFAMGIVTKLNKGKGLLSISAAMVSISAGMLLLAAAMKIMSTMSWEEMGVGLISLAVGLGALVAAVNLLPESKVHKAAAAIKKMSSAMLILSIAIKIMSTMSWEEMGVGLTTMVVGLGAMVGAVNLLPTTKVTSAAAAIRKMSVAMLILSGALKIMATMSWEEIGRGLTTMVAGLAALVLAMQLLPTDAALRSLGMMTLATSLVVLAGALKIMATMSWGDIAKSMTTLGGSIVILSLGLHAMKGTISGSAAMLVAVAALAALTPVLITLGALSWNSIVKGLVAIAGAFAVIGVAGALLSPILPAIIGLAGAIALIGAGVLAAGLGLAAFGAGLTSLAIGFTALSASIGVITVGIVKVVEAFIVGLIKGVGNGIVALCEVIADSATSIGDAVKAIILAVCDVVGECVPVLADTLLEVVVALLEALTTYTPQIVAGLFKFIIGIIRAIADYIPDFVKALFDIISSVFTGVIDALKSVDPDVLIKGILSVGLMAGVMAALSAVAGLVPGAMAGVLGMGVVIAELALVLAAIGALAQIPGLNWLINEGGKLLESIGTAIGGLIGGILGGIAKGFTSSLPEIGTDLSNFMTNLQPFLDGAARIDPSMMDGVKSLIGVIVSLTGANILESLTSWLTGGSSLVKFGEDLAEFAPNFRRYADTISGIDPMVVAASASAAKALAEMANHIPNSGGVVSWFAGENSITAFADELPILGQGLKGFSDQVVGINPENVIAASNAAKTLAEMTNHIPNSGGVVSWFSGDNSIAQFGSELIFLGMGLKGFSDQVTGIVPENLLSAANAAKSLADMTNSIPNSGGVVAWFSGENSISKFSVDLISLGMGLKGFSDAIVGVNPENILSASNAAKSLAEMTNHIPNSGGVVSWFTGDNSMSKFAGELPKLGVGLKGFSDSIVGINPENVTAAANAAKTLADMSNSIPNSGGVVSWFTGDNSLSKFATDLVSLGMGLKGFSDQVTGINAEHVTAAANAAKTLAEMTNHIPNSGGVVSWFTGENSLSKFSTELPKLGSGLKGFSESVTGIVPENVISASNAAKSLAEMTQYIPKEGGIKSWFTGETSIANFADKLPKLGEGLKGFSESVEGINAENLTAASNAAKAIAEMTGNTLKNVDEIPTLAENLKTLGSGMKSCFSKLGEITPESISSAKNAVKAVEEITKLDGGKTQSVANALDDLTQSIKNLASVPKNATAEFSSALSEMGKTSADSLLKAFKNIEPDMEKAGQNAVQSFINGLKSKLSAVETAAKSVATSSSSAITESKSKFTSAGCDLVEGFASGISANSYKAEAKARAMAKAAAKAAEEALDINSPSKVFRAIGYSVPEGFAMGIDKLSSMASDSATSMATESVNNVKNTIARIADVINSDIDAQPTIRPVLDLSNIESGAHSISGLFGAKSSVGVLARVGAISSSMKRYNQNEDRMQLASEIAKLRKDISNIKHETYNVNGITYDDGSNISEAVKTLIRATQVKRRS